MIKNDIEQLIRSALNKLQYPDQMIKVDTPAKSEFGDYSSNIAMQLAKDLKKNPHTLAEEIKTALPESKLIHNVEVVKPGFINFWISQKSLVDTLTKITVSSDTYGTSDVGNKHTVVVEYSSPNIAKPFTIGHLRSTIIGDSIANLLEAIGMDVRRDNHLGDWGTQFGKQIYAIKQWGNESEIESADHPVKKLVELYVKFHEEAEKNPDIEEEGRKWFKKLEEGDTEARRLWNMCIEWSWKEFNRIYELLGIHFTENNNRGYGESFFENNMSAVIQELREKKLLKESKGAELVFFPNDIMPPLMILKKDGATLYATRDLATDKFRLEHYGKDVTVINEVGAEQSLYWQQIFEVEQMLGWYAKHQRIHIKHGLFRFKDQKMSTRKGNVIWLEDVLNEAFENAKKLQDKNKDVIGDEDIWKIAVGALKWNELKRESTKDIVFDWDEIVNMEGNSGPYMQYTFVRCQSVLRQVTKSENIGELPELNQDELEVLRKLSRFPEVVLTAAQSYAPNIVTNYLYDLAQTYNLFYQKNPILKSEDKTKLLRLQLTRATAHIIKNGLNLLGIKTVEKM